MVSFHRGHRRGDEGWLNIVRMCANVTVGDGGKLLLSWGWLGVLRRFWE